MAHISGALLDIHTFCKVKFRLQSVSLMKSDLTKYKCRDECLNTVDCRYHEFQGTL